MRTYSYFTSLNGAVSVDAAPQTLADSKAGQALAEHLANAAATFEIINGRAVQVETLQGSAFPSTQQP